MAGARDTLNRIAFEHCIPIMAMLDLTSRCNHSCSFCYKRQVPPGDELTTAEVLGLLQELADLGTLSLQLTGGECLLREDFWEIAGLARSLSFKLSLYSNGDLIQQETARRLAGLGVAAVHLSLHGSSPELHDSLVGRAGSFHSVVSAVRQLRTEGVEVVLASLVTAANLTDVPALQRLAGDLGVPIRLDPHALSPDRHGPGDWRGPDRSVVEKAVVRQDHLQKFLDEPNRIPREPHLHICSAGRSRVRVDEQGNVFPCQALSLAAGNIRGGGFIHLWRTSEVLLRLRQMRFGDTRCTGCAHLPYCAPCIGRHHADTGSIYEPSPSVCWEAELRRQIMSK